MVYDYTQRRGPIAAMFKSPGPVYPLPYLCGQDNHDPRSTYRKYPSWTLKGRYGKFFDDCSPGPVHYPDVRLNRFGMDGTPAYSLYGRPKDVKVFQPPGPGTYQPEAAGPSAWPQAPKYSLGTRSAYRSMDSNPAPNSYTLPTMLGSTVEAGKIQAPVPSMKGRSNYGSFSEDLSKTPGPGTYGATMPETFQRKAPEWTLRSRVNMPGDTTRKPGPGTHYPEKVIVTRQSAPAHSFGIRWSSYVTPLIINVLDD